MLLLAAALIAAPQIGRRHARINPKADQPANCPATSRYEASKRGKAPRCRNSMSFRDADVYRAVYRRIGQCEAPIIVKFGVLGR